MRTVLIASLLAAATTIVPPPANLAPAFESSVSIVPTMTTGYPLTWQDPPTYTCRASVVQPHNPGTSHVWGYGEVSSLIVAAGHRETKTVHNGDYDTQLTVRINATADRAEATVTLLHDGEVLTRQRSEVWLGGSRRVR